MNTENKAGVGREKQVHTWVNRIHKYLEESLEIQAQLSAELISVRNDHSIPKAEDSEVEAQLVPLANELRSIARKIATTNEVYQGIIESLEI